MKACASCGVFWPLEDFPTTTNCRSYKVYYMRDCRICKARNAKTVRQLQKIFPRPPEGSPCELCGRAEKRLYYDHDHTKTGPESFRGFLCLRCNISACSYSVRELQQTIAYLRRYEARTEEADVSTTQEATESTEGFLSDESHGP
jgi:hypothetical protein